MLVLSVHVGVVEAVERVLVHVELSGFVEFFFNWVSGHAFKTRADIPLCQLTVPVSPFPPFSSSVPEAGQIVLE